VVAYNKRFAALQSADECRPCKVASAKRGALEGLSLPRASTSHTPHASRFVRYPRFGSKDRVFPNMTMRGKSSRRMPSWASSVSDLRESRWYCRALLMPSAMDDRNALRNVSAGGRPEGW